MATDTPYDDRFADLRDPGPSVTEELREEFPHYYKPVPIDPKTKEPYTHLDIYQIIDMWCILDSGTQHALKKLFCAGERGIKDYRKDLNEAIKSLRRQLEILDSRELTQQRYPE